MVGRRERTQGEDKRGDIEGGLGGDILGDKEVRQKELRKGFNF